MAGIINLRGINGNVCDAVADPPRSVNNKIPTEIPDVKPTSKDQCDKTEPNPPVNDQDTARVNDSTSDETKDFKPSAPKSNKKSKPAKEAGHSITINYKIEKCNVVNVGPQRKNIIYMNNFQNNNSAQNNVTKKKEFREMSEQIQKLSRSEKQLTTDDMLLIKTHLGKWREVAEKLDLSQGEIEQLYEDYKSLNVTEVVIQMLIKWQQKKSKAATVGRLVTAMWLCEAYDCVEKLAELHSDT